METGNETQAPTGGITLESIIEVLNNMGGKLNVVRGDITRMGDRLVNMEGQVNSTNSTPKATFRACTSGHDHTNSSTITPGTLHQALDPTLMQLGSNSQSTNQLSQPQLNPVNEVRNDENQEGYVGEGKGEEAPWNESPKNQPRGQVLQGGPRGRLDPMPFGKRQHGNHPQGGEQWEVNVNQEVGQEAREEHGNYYQ
ncbi:hypothetical protein KY289_001498 [Solanum tuberosum]|nr:hypothetical protein KY289_001498 [Solanum tuberosum]